jgi:sulfur carrier protein
MSETQTTGAAFEVRLNGEQKALAEGVSVADLLAELGKAPSTVAVELNGAILPRDHYSATRLSEGDQLEIVHFVQGG